MWDDRWANAGGAGGGSHAQGDSADAPGVALLVTVRSAMPGGAAATPPPGQGHVDLIDLPGALTHASA